ncbi:MAG TPA: NAD-dependent epimerase/dehydratase family protein [Nocardioidaceae bacterium]|nr:NAD-dependent epimerase/dehydratase family protein [Nocardioidaceae bacterium]
MQQRHLVIGAGPVGRATAEELARAGHEVVLASRSGGGPEVAGATRVAIDATDAEALTAAAEGATAIYNCVNPPAYDKWPTLWPPVAAALLAAAERTGAVLVTASNLYAYGPVDTPMVEGMPDAGTGVKARVRATMCADALAAHRAGRVRAVEVRGSDYMGAGVGDGGHIPRVTPRALAGKPVRVLGSPDQPHSWTDVKDMARALVAVAGTEKAWGRVWHAPTNPPRTQREAVGDVCRAAGKEPVAVRGYPDLVLKVGGLVSPMLRELGETVYQFDRPYLLDSSAITRELGLEPTPWDEVCRRTAGLEYCLA